MGLEDKGLLCMMTVSGSKNEHVQLSGANETRGDTLSIICQDGLQRTGDSDPSNPSPVLVESV